jgi:hypothetical protein
VKACLAAFCILLLFLPAVSLANDNFDAEPILYRTAKEQNAVARLQEQLDSKEVQIERDEKFGYLPSLLKALEIPESSQMLVFSKTSLQRSRIAPRTPRAIYFNDEVYVGYCQAGNVLEISAADEQLGTCFYTLPQERQASPRFEREGESCLTCHAPGSSHRLPSHLVRSVYVDASGLPMLAEGSFRVDHTTPIEQRWGGWYVTGTHGDQKHLGNLIVRQRTVQHPVENEKGQNVTELDAFLNVKNYLTPHSDLVALMVFEHQTQVHNAITQANFHSRQALHYNATLNRELGEPEDHRWGSTTSRIHSAGDTLLKCLLMCEEAKLTAPIQGTSGFAQEFAAKGSKDADGRSLRDLDLQTRLFKYPCSYLIGSKSFLALPQEVKDYVLTRLHDVLTGKDTSSEFSHLSVEDRQAILKILQDTMPELFDAGKVAVTTVNR